MTTETLELSKRLEALAYDLELRTIYFSAAGLHDKSLKYERWAADIRNVVIHWTPVICECCGDPETECLCWGPRADGNKP